LLQSRIQEKKNQRFCRDKPKNLGKRHPFLAHKDEPRMTHPELDKQANSNTPYLTMAQDLNY